LIWKQHGSFTTKQEAKNRIPDSWQKRHRRVEVLHLFRCSTHTHHLSHNFVTHHLSHTHNFVTQHQSHTHTALSYIHTQLCHTTSITHTQLCHTYTHNFVTHTIFHTQLCHTPSCGRRTWWHPPSFHNSSHTTFFKLWIFHHLLCLSFLPRPAATFVSAYCKKMACGVIQSFNVHFDFEMCFVPQQPALFPHLNFQTRSVHVVFCTIWSRHVLRATTSCTFSTSQLKVFRTWCAVYILTSKCASRHRCVDFSDISTSKSGPSMWSF